MLYEELRVRVEECKGGQPIPDVQKHRLAEAACERKQDLLAARAETNAQVGVARDGTDVSALVEACAEWASNERRLDELNWAMGCKGVVGDDRPLRARIGKIVRKVTKKPQLLADMMAEIEGAHPWSRALANNMTEMEEQLDSG